MPPPPIPPRGPGRQQFPPKPAAIQPRKPQSVPHTLAIPPPAPRLAAPVLPPHVPRSVQPAPRPLPSRPAAPPQHPARTAQGVHPAPDPRLTAVQPFLGLGLRSGLTALGVAVGYVGEAVYAGATLGSVAPGWGTAIGAAAGLVVGVGYAAYHSSPAPPPLEDERLATTIQLFQSLRDSLERLSLSAKNKETRRHVVFQIDVRIKKLTTLKQDPANFDVIFGEALGYASNAEGTVNRLLRARQEEPEEDFKETREQAAKNARAAREVDDSLADLIAFHKQYLAAPKVSRTKPSTSSSSTSSSTLSYAVRKNRAIADVQGEFRRCARDSRFQNNMHHSAYTIGHGPFSSVEKAEIRRDIQRDLQAWKNEFSISEAKVLWGKAGKGENFNIGCYAGGRQTMNLHFLW